MHLHDMSEYIITSQNTNEKIFVTHRNRTLAVILNCVTIAGSFKTKRKKKSSDKAR